MNNDPLNDFASDVRETAHRLMQGDFSDQSRQQAALRDRLVEQSRQRQMIYQRPSRSWHLSAAIATLAASLIVGVVLIQSQAPQPLTEAIIMTSSPQPMPMLAPSADDLPRFYDTLEEAARDVNTPLFAPDVPKDYSLSFVGLSYSRHSQLTATSVYFTRRVWQSTVLKGLPDNPAVDYLYVVQIVGDYGTERFFSLPSGIQYQKAEEKTLNVPSEEPYHYAFTTDNGYNILIWGTEGHIFSFVSRQLPPDALVPIAQSLHPLGIGTPFIPEQNAPGSCAAYHPGTGTSWGLPMQKDSYTLENGFRSGHPGLDFTAPTGTPVLAANGGTVVFAGESHYGYGNTVIISHGEKLTLYAQLKSVLVTCDQQVETGEVIGLVGSTGNSTGPHLHFEVIQSADGLRLDPAIIIPFQEAIDGSAR